MLSSLLLRRRGCRGPGGHGHFLKVARRLRKGPRSPSPSAWSAPLPSASQMRHCTWPGGRCQPWPGQEGGGAVGRPQAMPRTHPGRACRRGCGGSTSIGPAGETVTSLWSLAGARALPYRACTWQTNLAVTAPIERARRKGAGQV